MKAYEVLDFVGRETGVDPKDFPDGGFIAGSADDDVRGILVTWMATSEALLQAVEYGCNLVVCHEPLFFDEVSQPHMYRWTSDPAETYYEIDTHPNTIRRKIVEENGLTVLQIHYGLDRLCIFDDFAEAIGLGKSVAGDGYEKVYKLSRPMKVIDLANEVKNIINFDDIRIVGDSERVVSKAGNLWGGIGLSPNRYWMRKQIGLGAEVIVCGESDEFEMIYAREFGISLIVTSHAVSENIGLRNFALSLSKEFAAIPIKFFEVKVPFKSF